MVTFRASLNKGFGNVSIESDNEKEILENIKRLQSLGNNLEKILGFDIGMPQEVASKITDFEYIDRVLILLNYNNRPLSRKDCKKHNKILKIVAGWWIGSNFSRDLKRKKKLGLIEILEKEKPEYKITAKGRNYVKELLSKK